MIIFNILFFLILDDASIVIPASSKPEKTIKDKKASKKVSTSLIADETVSKKKKIKLCDEKDKAKVKNKRNAQATSTWQIEKLQCNKKMGSKTRKVVDVDDMFDSVEENIKRKVNLKVQKIKKKLETENKVNKHKKKENKEEEDYVPNLEFKNSKQKPILDLPLEETTSKGNSQQDTDLTSLTAVTNTEQESTDKSNGRAEEMDLQKCRMNTKPKYFKTQMPDLDVDGEGMLDDDNKYEDGIHRLMQEAFADENIQEEFRKEKEEEVC